MPTTQIIIIGVTGGKEWMRRRGKNLHPSAAGAGFALCNTLVDKERGIFPNINACVCPSSESRVPVVAHKHSQVHKQ